MGHKTVNRDANHGEISDHIKTMPWASVQDTAGMGGGFPDIIVGAPGVQVVCVEDVADQVIGHILADDYLSSVTALHRNCNLIVEIKTLSGKLRQNQIDWLETWRGHGTVWRSIEDVEKALVVG